jgi:hypothetical protein
VIELRCGFALIVLLLACGCGDTCENEVIESLPSPDKTKQAIMFNRVCGATAGFSTQISIVSVGMSPTGSGNVFVADDNHGLAVTGSWGGPWAEFVWASNQELEVRYATQSRIFLQRREYDGVAVTLADTMID